MIDKLNICSYRNYLENFLKRRYPNARNSDIEDAVQNALINAIRKQDQWEKSCSLKTWLSTITNNMYVNTFRGLRGKKETIVTNDEMNFLFNETPIDDFSDSICDRDYSNKLFEYLFQDTKNNECMQSFLLFNIHDLSYDEISIQQNIPIGTAKSRIFRARKLLKNKYQKYILLQIALAAFSPEKVLKSPLKLIFTF